MPRTRPTKPKEPTKVSIVYDTLRTLDDFITQSQLGTLLKSTVNAGQLSAALHMLRGYHAVECMEADGQLWWYATPDTDARTRQLEQRTPEDRPRKPRRTRQEPLKPRKRVPT